MTRTTICAAIAMAMTLSGCGVWQKKEVPVDPADVALAEAARSIEAAWSRSPLRGTVEDVTAPEMTSGDAQFEAIAADESSPLAQRVDITWVGDLQPAVEALAEVAGYTATAVGLRKGPPILIMIDGVDVPLLEMLRQAGTQAGTRADVVVRESEGVIEVIYRD